MAKQQKREQDEGGKVPTPKMAAREALAFMKTNADEERAASFQRFFKEPVEVYGVGYAALKARRKEVAAQVLGTWTLDDALLYCEEMLKNPHLESRGNAFQTVGDFVEEAGPELLEHIHRWLESFCGNWGLVDNLVPSVLISSPAQIPGPGGRGGGMDLLLEQGSRTPRTTLRYAIEKFPKEDRKRIMGATKA